jgi:hypothetical protein
MPMDEHTKQEILARARAKLRALAGVERDFAADAAERDPDAQYWQSPEPPRARPQSEADKPTFTERQKYAIGGAISILRKELRDHVAEEIRKLADETKDAVAEFVSVYTRQKIEAATAKLREEFDRQLGELRADQTVDRSLTRTELKALRGTVKRRNGDAAH